MAHCNIYVSLDLLEPKNYAFPAGSLICEPEGFASQTIHGGRRGQFQLHIQLCSGGDMNFEVYSLVGRLTQLGEVFGHSHNNCPKIRPDDLRTRGGQVDLGEFHLQPYLTRRDGLTRIVTARHAGDPASDPRHGAAILTREPVGVAGPHNPSGRKTDQKGTTDGLMETGSPANRLGPPVADLGDGFSPAIQEVRTLRKGVKKSLSSSKYHSRTSMSNDTSSALKRVSVGDATKNSSSSASSSSSSSSSSSLSGIVAKPGRSAKSSCSDAAAAVTSTPALDCCDICNPKLFDHTRPGKPVRATRQKGIRRGPPVDSVRQALFKWRRNIKKMHFPRSLLAPHAFLDEAACELLASVGPIESLDMLKQLLASGWSFWDEFGSRLYVYLHAMDIPPVPAPPPRKKKGADSNSASEPSPAGSSTAARKRVHPTHGTAADDSATPAQRQRLHGDFARTEDFSTTGPLGAPRPITPLHPVSRPLVPHSASSSRTPANAIYPSPPVPIVPPYANYMPSTPQRLPNTYSPSPYPSPFPTQVYDPRAYYSPHQGVQTQSSPYYPSPQSFTHPSHFYHPSHTPSALRNNPYASWVSPTVVASSQPVLHNVGMFPASSQTPSAPSSSMSPSVFDPSSSSNGQ
ncbi:hypothetical protein C8R46DRAFT_1266200 [Mycena filopes]|nr:hypothetical protein C8R46DRAFT_1266200 [Mycena filopes]